MLCRAADFTDFLKVQASLAGDRQALDLEKEQLQHISVADNDILTLGVGGTAFGTNRSTLTQVSAQVFAAYAGHLFFAVVCTRCNVTCIAAL